MPSLRHALTAPTPRDNRRYRGAGPICSNNRLLTIEDGPYDSTQSAVSALRRVALYDGLRFKSSGFKRSGRKVNFYTCSTIDDSDRNASSTGRCAFEAEIRH